MNRLQVLKAALAGSASVIAFVQPAAAKPFDIPAGDLSVALVTYMKQSDVDVIYADNVVRGRNSRGARGDYTETAALDQILKGTGFAAQTMPMNTIAIVPAPEKPKPAQLEVAQAAPRKAPAASSSVETVVVTAQKKAEDIQQVPIAITALSQKDLTERQIAGGPDLVKEVPNLTFSKTNFSGYNLEIRGIGTQAISVTTDPAVAVAFNGTPFIRNHFFEQEFYDLQDVEVLRGPQGTLYGRNATAGVVNIKSALPDDTYQAMLSADMGNYSNRRLEGMLNIPIVGDKLDIRFAGEWTKRDGYTPATTTDTPVDGRDLWSGRATLSWKPASNVQTYLVWEHFSEDDDRLRSGKQLCKQAPFPVSVDGVPVPPPSGDLGFGGYLSPADFLSQGCEDTSLYSPNAYEVPNPYSLPYYTGPLFADTVGSGVTGVPPYSASEMQSTNLRQIESQILPAYKAKNDTLEFNADWTISPSLTFTSQTGYNHDFLWSTEDFNRFGSAPGFFLPSGTILGDDGSPFVEPDPSGLHVCVYTSCGAIGSPCAPSVTGCVQAGAFCDPQLGCSDRLEAEDLSEERAWQLSQEFRLASNFAGPVNFSVGGNFLHYETVENYYVFINSITLFSYFDNLTRPVPSGVNNNSSCIPGSFRYPNPSIPQVVAQGPCPYVDPNPIGSLDNQGHNYFLSQNPYVLNSYALFGELYYDVAKDLKLTLGGRWTVDQKHFLDIPSEIVVPGYGYEVTGIVNQTWERPTGRAVLDWTPQLDFTDQTLIYASAAHGYKAGGANPPGAIYPYYFCNSSAIGSCDVTTDPIHPLTFKPEYIEAFELGTKNTLLDNSLTLNGDIFYYNYTGYQISEIVDRTAINNNFNAHVEGAEFEANWEPLPGLKFSLAQGFENTALAGGDQSVDLIDRTAGNPNWIVVKPSLTVASNCILPTYVAAALIDQGPSGATFQNACNEAYNAHLDPVTNLSYVQNPAVSGPSDFNPTPPGIPAGYPGFNPASAPNNGGGFDKNVGGNQLPNAPHFTTSLTAEYTMPVSDDWAATLHTDFYWQSQQWARVFEDPIDKIHGYSNVNLSLILTSATGWQVIGYIKNVFDTTAITGTFLNSDDTGLTTNVFLTDPRLYGVRVTKQLDQNDGFWGSDYSGYDFFSWLFADADNGKPPLWIELGGQLDRLQNTQKAFAPPFFAPASADVLAPMVDAQKLSLYDFGEYAKATFEPEGSDWVIMASIRYGRANATRHLHQETNRTPVPRTTLGHPFPLRSASTQNEFGDGQGTTSESHLLLDFQAGRDVGLGFLGENGTSVVGGGLRFANFTSGSNITLHARPTLVSYGIRYPGKYVRDEHFHSYSAVIRSRRSTRALGPAASWNASLPVAGDSAGMSVAFDWGVNGALLFGRQKAQVHHQTAGRYFKGRGMGYVAQDQTQYVNPPVDHSRARAVTIPNVGGFAGVSFDYRNAKLSFGYRGDFFFNAMDTGWDTRKSGNLGFLGPFASISIGFGG